MEFSIKTYDAPFYASVIDRYIETGLVPSIDFVQDPRGDEEIRIACLNAGDPLLRYMHSVMTNPFVLFQVTTSEVCAAIFRDTMYNMVALFMEKQQFHLQINQSNYRQIAEAREWSVRRQQNGWQALVQKAKQSTGGYLNTLPYMALFDNPDFWDVERRKRRSRRALAQRLPHPPCSPARLQDMALLRSQHTRLYALQIGMAVHDWRTLFDGVEHICWMTRMKY